MSGQFSLKIMEKLDINFVIMCGKSIVVYPKHFIDTLKKAKSIRTPRSFEEKTRRSMLKGVFVHKGRFFRSDIKRSEEFRLHFCC